MKKKILEKEKEVYVCPKCGSADIVSGRIMAGLGVGIPEKMCNHCGHTSQIFPKILISELKTPKNPKEIKDRNLVSLTYFFGLMNVWKFTGIVVLLFSLAGLFISDARKFALFLLPLAILITTYSFLREKYKEKLFMKLIMIIIIFYLIFGPLIILMMGQ